MTFVQNQKIKLPENLGCIAEPIADYYDKDLSHNVSGPTGVNLLMSCSLLDINVFLWTFIVYPVDVLMVVVVCNFWLKCVRGTFVRAALGEITSLFKTFFFSEDFLSHFHGKIFPCKWIGDWGPHLSPDHFCLIFRVAVVEGCHCSLIFWVFFCKESESMQNPKLWDYEKGILRNFSLI